MTISLVKETLTIQVRGPFIYPQKKRKISTLLFLASAWKSSMLVVFPQMQYI